MSWQNERKSFFSHELSDDCKKRFAQVEFGFLDFDLSDLPISTMQKCLCCDAEISEMMIMPICDKEHTPEELDNWHRIIWENQQIKFTVNEDIVDEYNKVVGENGVK